MKDGEHEAGPRLDHYYLLKVAWIMTKPVGGQSTPPDDAGPGKLHCIDTITETRTRQASVPVQSSKNPISATLSSGKQAACQRPAFTVEPRLKHSQNGEEQGYEWY